MKINVKKDQATKQLLAEEREIMMMNMKDMNEIHLEWWKETTAEITARRRAAREEATGAADVTPGGGGDGADGGPTSIFVFEGECQGLADLNTGLVALISMQLLKLVHQLINMLGSRQKSEAIVSIPKEMKQIESSRRCAKDGELDKFVYVCNKSGKPREEEAVPVKQRNRKLTVLTDCKAKLRVKRDGARWKVTQFVEVHTHEVIDKFALKKYLRSHNKIPAEEKKFIDLLHEVNLTSGRIMEIMGELYGSKQNVPYNSKTVSNYTAKLGNYDRIKDIPELLEYFEEIKKDDPRFFYRFKLDAENKVENLFWVDSKARDVHPLYNDCNSFDTTFMTNQYGQSIQLGCGFVRNESSVNFVWLFERFLEAMDGLHPLNIITDQDAAIRTAILIVFIGIIHRFCRWHIMQKVQEKLGTFVAQREDLRLEFNDVIDYSMTPEEFEQRWVNMVETHGVADNTHFLDLYDLREYFVPAYFRHRFFPFLQTTSRSEGFNAVLKQYVHPHDSLVRFFKQYMKLQERIDVTEDAHEFDGDEKTVRLWGDFPMEKQILQTYTMPIYHRFQLELRKITSHNVRDIGVTEQGSIHEVFPIQGSMRGYGRRSYRVDADVANGIYNCECCKINRDGILCCHALKVMTHLGMVTKYLEHYILPRWCLPPPDIVAPRDERQEKPVGQKLSRKDMRLLRYGNLCSDFAKLAVGLAASEKTNEIAKRHMRAMEKEMADLKKANADALKKRKSAKHPVNTNTANDSQESVPMEEDAATVENRKARNPSMSATKGRPGSKRKKGGLQLQKPKQGLCGVCKQPGHDTRTCEVRLANPEKYSLLGLFH
nr:protein FAR1-RELATED SEQUENCE 5-like [Lolium perenne]